MIPSVRISFKSALIKKLNTPSSNDAKYQNTPAKFCVYCINFHSVLNMIWQVITSKRKCSWKNSITQFSIWCTPPITEVSARLPMLLHHVRSCLHKLNLQQFRNSFDISLDECRMVPSHHQHHQMPGNLTHTRLHVLGNTRHKHLGLPIQIVQHRYSVCVHFKCNNITKEFHYVFVSRQALLKHHHCS